MNLRPPALGVLLLLALTGCSPAEKEPTASPLSFAPIANDASTPVPAAGGGTVCGSVPVPKGKADVVVRAGRVNCADALRAGRVYAAAAANAEGRGVSVETGGWHCTDRGTEPEGSCRQGENAFSVG
ncbi:hypothetical protein [Tsukamurella sp. 1534]|uniref:hypothetical protein n=1 Tax=Tsukamurella sp. 1534 TaxID=1151061 RepID=UPI0002D643F6|nr:hypothetical protein [Tsukamurella sp. 1534]